MRGEKKGDINLRRQAYHTAASLGNGILTGAEPVNSSLQILVQPGYEESSCCPTRRVRGRHQTGDIGMQKIERGTASPEYVQSANAFHWGITGQPSRAGSVILANIIRTYTQNGLQQSVRHCLQRAGAHSGTLTLHRPRPGRAPHQVYSHTHLSQLQRRSTGLRRPRPVYRECQYAVCGFPATVESSC